MRTPSLAALLFPSLLAAAPELPQAPGGGPVRMEVLAGDRVTVISSYWRAGFDLRNGGVLDSIVFPHGSGKNLLIEPLRTYAGDWSDANAPATEFKSSQDGDVVTLTFSGRMAATGRVAGPVSFESTWTLSPFAVRASHTLTFAEDVRLSTVGIGSGAVRRDLEEWALRPGPAADSDGRKQAPAAFGRASDASLFIDERHAPVSFLLFHRGVEGLDFLTASDLGAWESALAGRPGLGRFQVRRTPSRTEITREPLHSIQPVTVRKGAYTFSYYLGLPRIVEKADRKWRHLSFGNHPWPSNAEVDRWAESGVNIVRVHNDYSEDNNFWHDGAWPPYDEKGMAELRRVVAACHRHGIKVVPYFSVHEFHPEASGYREHEAAWKRTNGESAPVYHNAEGKGEFGAQMCPQSGWLERRKDDIERAYRELGFDGIYYDWTWAMACDNKAHNPRLHTGADGIVDLLAWTRRLIAPKQGVLIVHIYGQMPSITLENFGDLIVNMEEVSSASGMMKIDEIPLPTVYAESIPRSPCPSYRKDLELERNRNNISQLIVLGMFPWSGPPDEYAYPETLKLFRAFKGYKLENMRFRDAFSGAIRSGSADVYGALYSRPDMALAVVSNTSGQPRRNVSWAVKQEALGFQSKRVSVRAVAGGTPRVMNTDALEDGSLATELGPWEYRLFEIRPAE